MNLIQIEKVLSNLITNSFVNPNVKIGCIYENLNTDEIKYPVVDIDCESATKSQNEDIYNFIVYYVDRLTESEDNLNNIQSDGITAIKLLVRKLSNNEDFEVELPISITPFHQTFNHTTFADNCAGAWARLTIHTEDAINYCSEEITPSTININKNGEYEVLGYDKAVVNIQPSIDDVLSDKYSDEAKEGFMSMLNRINNVPVVVTKNSTNFNEQALELPSNIDWSIRTNSVQNWFSQSNFINFVADMSNHPSRYNMGNSFLCNCNNLEYIHIKFSPTGFGPTWFAFQNNPQLKEVVFEDLQTTDGREWFKGCNNLEKITLINGWKKIDVEQIRIADLPLLKTIEGEIYSTGYNLDFRSNTVLKDLKIRWEPGEYSRAFTADFTNSNNLSVESLTYFVEHLGHVPTQGSSFTIRFGAANLAKLTQEQITSMTNKGWTVSA